MRNLHQNTIALINDSDALSEKAGMLAALTAMIAGEGCDAFRSLNEDLQDQYLYCVSNMAAEVRSLAERATARSDAIAA